MTDSGNRPQVSVIIPARNEAATIAATALSAREAGADEVIAVDGESLDGTPDAARPVVDAVILSPPGRARQMNAGARASRGEILLFLHADTTMPEGSIASVREAMKRDD
ncbi:MAG: glycosyltransferase, partial [Deltaproteobacteria bacterium]|nr:glycosyltransferase [Deltaproteobacteria bacterium]